MSGSELNKIRDDTVKIFRRSLKDNLFAIVCLGSIASKNYKKAWSDADFLVVVEKLNLRTKQKIAQAIEILEKTYKRSFGINTITQQEFQNPISPSISLDGKTLQGLLDLKLSPQRLIFSKKKLLKEIYFPNMKEIRNYSLSNIYMFLLRNRKTLSKDNPHTLEEYRNTVAKEMRAGFIMTRLAIQYFSLYNCQNKREIIKKAENIFSDFNFRILKSNLKWIDNWDKVKRRRELDKILETTDKFIEDFSQYVSKLTTQKKLYIDSGLKGSN